MDYERTAEAVEGYIYIATFGKKRAAGERQLLEIFENHLSRRIRFTTSVHICSFNQLDKEKIVSGFKRKITREMAMTWTGVMSVT